MVGTCASQIINFLPMEDALSSARNTPSMENPNSKPYRQPFSLNAKNSTDESFFSFSNTDLFAFIVLLGIYIALVRKKSKPRNISL